MFYDERKKRIGAHIEQQRKAHNMTQAELLQAAFLSPTSTASLRRWEKGESLPDLDTLTRMAEIFDCDIGYLLADYEEEHRVTADVAEETGLSGKAILTLKKMNDKNGVVDINGLSTVSKLLETYMIPSAAEDLEIWSHPERETPIEDVLREITKYLHAPLYSGNKYKGILMSWKDIIQTACHFRINNALDELRGEITCSQPLVRNPDDAKQQALYDELNPHKKANEEGEAANGKHTKDTRRKRDKL